MSVRLYEGAIGTTRLRTADARAAIDARQRLDFALELAPSDARGAGHAKVSGIVPLSEVRRLQCPANQSVVEHRLQGTAMPRWQANGRDVLLFRHEAAAAAARQPISFDFLFFCLY